MKHIVFYINRKGAEESRSFKTESDAFAFCTVLDGRIKRGTCGGYSYTSNPEEANSFPQFGDEDPLDTLPQPVWIWADMANAIIKPLPDGTFMRETAYDDFEPVTAEELLQECLYDLRCMAESYRDQNEPIPFDVSILDMNW